jgi:hypothetical protein
MRKAMESRRIAVTRRCGHQASEHALVDQVHPERFLLGCALGGGLEQVHVLRQNPAAFC